MATVEVREIVSSTADAVWDLVRDFGDISRWSKGISSCEVDGEGIGAVRTMKLGDLVIRERLEAFDDAARRFSYSIVEAPLPLQEYLSTFEVTPAAEGSEIVWSSRFEHAGVAEADAKAMVEGIYRQGIAGIRKALS